MLNGRLDGVGYVHLFLFETFCFVRGGTVTYINNCHSVLVTIPVDAIFDFEVIVEALISMQGCLMKIRG